MAVTIVIIMRIRAARVNNPNMTKKAHITSAITTRARDTTGPKPDWSENLISSASKLRVSFT